MSWLRIVLSQTIMPQPPFVNGAAHTGDMKSNAHLMDDDVYWSIVHAFLEEHPHSTIPQRLESGHPIALDYFRTTRSQNMKICLIKLHQRFNLTNIIPSNILNDLMAQTRDWFFGEAQHRAMILAPYPPPFKQTMQPPINISISNQGFVSSAPSLIVASSYRPLTSPLPPYNASIPITSQNAEFRPMQQASSIVADGLNAIPQTNANDMNTAATTTANPTSPKITVVGEEARKEWRLACSECGFFNRWRDLRTHMKNGRQIIGLQIYQAMPEREMVWYGRDSQGNHYQGAMARSADFDGQYQDDVGYPCGDGVRAERNARKAREDARKKEKAEKKAVEEREAGNEPQWSSDASASSSGPSDPLPDQYYEAGF